MQKHQVGTNSNAHAVSSMTAVATPSDTAEPFPKRTSHWSESCEHKSLAARFKRGAGGRSKHARMQCLSCGRGVGQFISSFAVTEPWDQELQDRVEKERNDHFEAWVIKRDEFLENSRRDRSKAWWHAYSDYLRSDVWRRKRGLVFDRALRLNNGMCECCGEFPPDQVHHTSYPKTFGHEPLWTLQAVCMRCHKVIHPHTAD